ncbi:thiol S-methyltransferase TMT1B-like isoform X1 [Amphiura filiformis]|uniref:thiol S-methyltransferase TMT1B-like isoform X1 n=1 Tax=Amphiura filiformis TaxID=82378 RepID=UPI003B21E174
MAAGIFGFIFYIFSLIWSLIVALIGRIYCWIWFNILSVNMVKYDKRIEEHKLELFADLADFKEDTEVYPITPVVQQSRSPSRRKQQTAVDDKFTILEIGVGWGGNFRYFPEGSDIIAVEPTFPKERFAEYLAMIHSHGHGVQISKVVATDPEDLSQVETETADVVVCTKVLSNVRNVDQVLQEIRRVLKTGGRFYFMEHVFQPERSFTHYTQRLLNPLQVKFGDNCHLTRETWKNIDKAGFAEVRYKRFSAYKMPSIIRPHLMGTATK